MVNYAVEIMPEVVEKEPEQNQDESKVFFIMERRKYIKTEGFVAKQKNKMQHPTKQSKLHF